jgi:3-hydroxyacyl-[acyl-carrier-protein] dehydratase
MRNDNLKRRLYRVAIEQILPHRPPFLFVDHILEFKSGVSIVTEKYVSAREDFFTGHFPDEPVMPGVLITEALAQTSGLLIGLTLREKDPTNASRMPRFALTTTDMKFLQPVVPESRLKMHAELQKKFGSLYRFRVEGVVANAVVAKGILSLGGFSNNGGMSDNRNN